MDYALTSGIKCTIPDLGKNLFLTASRSTILRTVHSFKYSYMNVKRKFYLSSKARKCRMDLSKDFIVKSLNWHNVIFTDEKFFTLNGCDSYMCWVRDGCSPKSVKRVLKAPGIMIWGMLFPNGLLSYHVMKGRQNASKYVDILEKYALPLIKCNFKDHMILQQDNCPIHAARYTQQFLQNQDVETLKWPPYSPDINIIENVWYILSGYVYDKGPIKNLSILSERIKNAVRRYNEENQDTTAHLYSSITSRLLSIIIKKGDRIKY